MYSKTKYCWTRNLPELSNTNIKGIVNGNCFLQKCKLSTSSHERHSRKLKIYHTNLKNSDQEENFQSHKSIRWTRRNSTAYFLVVLLELKFPARAQAFNNFASDVQHSKTKYCWTRNLPELSNINIEGIVDGTGCFEFFCIWISIFQLRTNDYRSIAILNSQTDSNSKQTITDRSNAIKNKKVPAGNRKSCKARAG